ncbi:MAG: LA2681 family HEPN domain-containing protein, partial [Methanomassiliicoccaceae archaeon]|nr:LA2681 family HEPN domain-containing protein [Methanomassiliicoccaceae archaeon]
LFLSVFNMLPTIDDRPMMDDIFCDFQGDNREMQIALFDDIKQSFAYARYQYYSCVDSRMNINAYSKPHFSLKLDHDGRTPIAAHGFTEVQELIECYMRLYSILDKIGNLMNSVHDLKIGSKNKKEKPSIRTVASVIDSLSDNPFLVQMKTIFMETNPEYAEDSHEMPFYIPMPSAMHMDSVRNHLAHIGLGFVSDENEDKVSDDVVQYITWSEFLILTDHLMSIVKEAIFTVWASVNYISFSPEMKKKLKSLLFDNKFALLMKYDLLLNISKRE